jgi:hypothetical protein
MKTLIVVTSLLAATPAFTQPINCTKTSGLAVDADGAPDSYRVDGKGLSYTCDGVFAVVDGVAHTQNNDPAHWQELCAQHWHQAQATGDYSQVKIVGFEQDARGPPVVQGSGDPLPGAAFLTTTKLTIPGTPVGTQRHYVNAVEIPYVVLSSTYAARHRLRLGDLVAVFRPRTGRIAFGVYGDCCSIGEASVRLHQDLGSNPIVTKPDGTRRAKQGVGDTVFFVALSGEHTTPTTDVAAWRTEIKSKGEAALSRLGGIAAARTCAAR